MWHAGRLPRRLKMCGTDADLAARPNGGSSSHARRPPQVSLLSLQSASGGLGQESRFGHYLSQVQC